MTEENNLIIVDEAIKDPPLIQYFPYPTYYPYQYNALQKAIESLDEYDTIFLEAPWGIGKSGVAFCIGEQNQDYYITCNRLGLLNQYNRSFSGQGLIQAKGRANFHCPVIDDTADKGPCTIIKEFKCPMKDECQYLINRDRARDSPRTLMSLKYGFRIVGERRVFDKRKMCIFDEGHDLERDLMDEITIHITERDLALLGHQFPDLNTIRQWGRYIEALDQEILDAMQEKKDELGEVNPEALDPEQERILKLFNKLEGFHSKLKYGKDIRENPDNWVIMKDTNQWGQFVDIKPVEVHYFNDELTKFSKKRIIMSATLNPIIIKSLGFKPEDTLYIQVKHSPFPIEQRQVYIEGSIGKMTKNYIETTMPRMLDYIATVCRNYPKVKGLILPYTHNLSRRIANHLIQNQMGERVITHGDDWRNRDKSIQMFLETGEPLILISTYVNQGWSFDDDLTRFIIIPKIPYPYLGDPQIRKRAHRDNKWYQWQTIQTLVQMVGRGVRSPSDWCDIYITDGAFMGILVSHGELFPSFFTEALTRDHSRLYGYNKGLVQ